MEEKRQQLEREAQQQQQYVKKLLDGEIPIPNAIVDYLIKQIRDANTEAHAVAKTLQQAEKVATASRERMIELRGINRKYTQDIYANKDSAEEPEVIPAPITPAKTKSKLEKVVEGEPLKSC